MDRSVIFFSIRVYTAKFSLLKSYSFVLQIPAAPDLVSQRAPTLALSDHKQAPIRPSDLARSRSKLGLRAPLGFRVLDNLVLHILLQRLSVGILGELVGP